MSGQGVEQGADGNQDYGRFVRISLAIAAVWLVLAIFPLARDVTLIKVVGFQLLVLAAAVVAWRQGRMEGAPRVHGPLALAVLVLTGALLAAVPFATNPGYALMELSRLAPGVLAFFLAAHVYRQSAQLSPLLIAATAALTLASLYGLLQWYGWDPFPWAALTAQDLDLLRRAPATYGNPNLAAHAVILGIPLVLLLTANGHRWALLFLPILAAHLAINGTRGALTALTLAAVTVAVAWACTRMRALPPNAAVAAALLVPLMLAAATGAYALGSAYQRTGSAVPSDMTLTLRLHSTHGAAEMIRDRPLIGHAPGHFVIDNAPYWSSLEQARYAELGRRNTRVHNEPLDLAVQGGLVAGAAYLALLVIAMLMALRMAQTAAEPAQRRLGLAFTGVFTAFAVDGLFGFNLHAPVSGGLFWLLLGAFAGLHARPWTRMRAKGQGRVRAALPAVAGAAFALGVMGMSASVFALRGDGARYYGEAEAAHGQYEMASRLNPWEWRFRQALGGVMLDQSFYASAAKHFEEALALNPNDPASLAGIARAQALRASHIEAEGLDGVEETEQAGLEAAERASALCPPLVDAALARASILGNRLVRTRGESAELVDEAEAAAGELLALAPDAARQAWQLFANVRAIRGDAGDAAEAFAHALTHGPDDARTWQAFENLAHHTAAFAPYLDSIRWREERLRLEQPDAAEERATMALRRAKSIAAGYDAPGQVSVAFAIAAQAEPMRPGLWPSFYAYARQHENQMRAFRAVVEDAGRTLEELAGPSPPPAALPVLIAGLAARGEDSMPAAAENCYQAIAFERVQQQQPVEALREDYGWVWTFLADEAERLPADAESTGLVLLRLGMAAVLLDEDARALAVLTAAEPNLPLEPRVECLRQMGEVAMRLGEQEAAIGALIRATQLAPRNLGAQLDYARALATAGEADAARLVYRRILGSFQFDGENRARIQAEMNQVGRN